VVRRNRENLLKIPPDLEGFFLFYNLKEFIEAGFSLHGFEDSIFSHEHKISLSREFDDFLRASTISDKGTDII
jgi:hypothetical protein